MPTVPLTLGDAAALPTSTRIFGVGVTFLDSRSTACGPRRSQMSWQHSKPSRYVGLVELCDGVDVPVPNTAVHQAAVLVRSVGVNLRRSAGPAEKRGAMNKICRKTVRGLAIEPTSSFD